MRRCLLDTGSAADCIFRRRGVDERVKQARRAGDKIGIGIPVPLIRQRRPAHSPLPLAVTASPPAPVQANNLLALALPFGYSPVVPH